MGFENEPALSAIDTRNSCAEFMPAMLGQAQLAELPPPVAGARLSGPSFVGVGVGKAGTSWWYALLLQHPRIVDNRLQTKELHFFDHLRMTPLTDYHIALYRKAFAVAEGYLAGEWSPNYLTWPFALQHLARAAPAARILVILRNPVDRTLSAINQQHTALLPKFNFSDAERYIYETYTIFPRTINNSLYADGLRRLFSLFGRERVLILQYERCRQAPRLELSKTYAFLGVDAEFRPQGLTNPVNRIDYVVPGFTAEQRTLLADYLRADVEETLALVPDLDRTLWQDFPAQTN
jgi:hypothetical protein